MVWGGTPGVAVGEEVGKSIANRVVHQPCEPTAGTTVANQASTSAAHQGVLRNAVDPPAPARGAVVRGQRLILSLHSITMSIKIPAYNLALTPQGQG